MKAWRSVLVAALASLGGCALVAGPCTLAREPEALRMTCASSGTLVLLWPVQTIEAAASAVRR